MYMLLAEGRQVRHKEDGTYVHTYIQCVDDPPAYLEVLRSFVFDNDALFKLLYCVHLP